MGPDEVVGHSQELERPRSSINRPHPLVSGVVIALMAVLAGAGGPTAIAGRAALDEEVPLDALDLPRGTPREDVFRRALMAPEPGAFRARFANRLRSSRDTAAAATGLEQPILAVDRESARRGHDRKNGLGALHPVSVRPGEFGLSPGQAARAERSHEIAAIPELLRPVDIEGAIITIDAMGAQKAIAARIIEGRADHVPALKASREASQRGVIDHPVERSEAGFADAGARRHGTEATGPGRTETRGYIQMPAPEDLPELERWKGVKSMGPALSECVRGGKEAVESRCVISSVAWWWT